jgi:hypothetical protein
LVAGEDGRAAVEVGQGDGDGVGDTGAGHLLGAAGDLRLHGLEREPDEGRGPVDARGLEPDVRNRRSARLRRGQREQGVDHRRTQNELQLIPGHEPTFDQHGTDIAVGLITTAQQITQFGRGLENATETSGQIRHPCRARESDLTLIKVDGPGRISVHFENARRVLSP